MPIGTRYIVTGILRRAAFGYVIELEGGGKWQLDVGRGRAARRCVDRRKVVDGIRLGFNALTVNHIETA